MTVFITRDLPADSIFYHELTALGHTVIGRSMLRFEGLPFATIPACNWWFFYSPRGVRYFYDSLSASASGKKIATIGARTAEAVRERGGAVHFTGIGSPEEIAREFRQQLHPSETVLFVRAEESRRSVQQYLPTDRQEDLIVYRSLPIPREIPPAELLVFTSPLNYRSFLKSNTIHPRQRIIAIGPTTAAAIGKRCNAVAPRPEERFLTDFVKTFLENF